MYSTSRFSYLLALGGPLCQLGAAAASRSSSDRHGSASSRLVVNGSNFLGPVMTGSEAAHANPDSGQGPAKRARTGFVTLPAASSATSPSADAAASTASDAPFNAALLAAKEGILDMLAEPEDSWRVPHDQDATADWLLGDFIGGMALQLDRTCRPNNQRR